MYTREEAIRECVVLWGWLAKNSQPEHGPVVNKEAAIQALVEAGRLGMASYNNNCPLCEYVYGLVDGSCVYCPWPGEGGMRCVVDGGVYYKWVEYTSRERAAKVLRLVKTFK